MILGQNQWGVGQFGSICPNSESVRILGHQRYYTVASVENVGIPSSVRPVWQDLREKLVGRNCAEIVGAPDLLSQQPCEVDFHLHFDSKSVGVLSEDEFFKASSEPILTVKDPEQKAEGELVTGHSDGVKQLKMYQENAEWGRRLYAATTPGVLSLQKSNVSAVCLAAQTVEEKVQKYLAKKKELPVMTVKPTSEVSPIVQVLSVSGTDLRHKLRGSGQVSDLTPVVKAPGPIKSARAESEDDLPGITVEAGPYMLHEELDYEPAGDYDPAVDGAPKGVVPYDPTEMPPVKLETGDVPKKRTVLRPLKGKTGAELQVELFGFVEDVKPVVASAPAKSGSDLSFSGTSSATSESDCSSSSESESDRAPRRKKRKGSSSRSRSPVRRKLSSASVKKYVDSLSAKERARQRKELKAYMESAAAKQKKKKADKRRREKEELRASPKRKRSGRDLSPVYEGSSRDKSREIATSSGGCGGSSKKIAKYTKVRNTSIF
jgi:hypothetical protein